MGGVGDDFFRQKVNQDEPSEDYSCRVIFFRSYCDKSAKEYYSASSLQVEISSNEA